MMSDFTSLIHLKEAILKKINSDSIQVEKLRFFFSMFFPEILWILTRPRFPSKYLIDHLYKKIRRLGLDTRRLRRTDQKTCPA